MRSQDEAGSDLKDKKTDRRVCFPFVSSDDCLSIEMDQYQVGGQHQQQINQSKKKQQN